jgi:hypothetical protein
MENNNTHSTNNVPLSMFFLKIVNITSLIEFIDEVSPPLLTYFTVCQHG